MQEIVQAFGIDWKLIVIQIFNFGILTGALWYFLYTPILKLLKEREEKIAKGVTDAEAASIALRNAEDEKSLILKEARKEAVVLVDQGKKHADHKVQEILATAEYKASEYMKNAEKSAHALRELAQKESEAEIARLAILGAEKVLNEKLL